MDPLLFTLNRLRAPQADWVGIREVWERTTTRTSQDEKPHTNSTNTNHGFMVEVLKDGWITYAATPDGSFGGIQMAVDEALRWARIGAPYGICQFTLKQRPPTQGSYQSPVSKPLCKHTAKDLNDFLIEACRKMKVSQKIHRTTSTVHLVESWHHVVGTQKANFKQDFSFLSTHFKATAMEENLVQSRSNGGFLANSQQGGLESLDATYPLETIGEQAVELLYAQECPKGRMDLVLMPDQMMMQIHESVGHPLEIDRILGDERNYAGSSFVHLHDFGSLTYGSPLMNVCFDPGIPNGYASYAFDENGQPAKKEFLIKDGKLVRGLGGLESQMRSKIPGVANARSCMWNRPPIDRIANINLEPGNHSFKEIIQSVKRGVLMESNCSWSIDDFRRKFQFGCEYAKLIEDGQITKTLRNPNYRGITVPFWKKLKMVGQPQTLGVYGSPYCGKGEPNQVIRVGHASPVCLFSDVEVFGGGLS